jgi:hypothetical protein
MPVAGRSLRASCPARARCFLRFVILTRGGNKRRLPGTGSPSLALSASGRRFFVAAGFQPAEIPARKWPQVFTLRVPALHSALARRRWHATRGRRHARLPDGQVENLPPLQRGRRFFVAAGFQPAEIPARKWPQVFNLRVPALHSALACRRWHATWGRRHARLPDGQVENLPPLQRGRRFSTCGRHTSRCARDGRKPAGPGMARGRDTQNATISCVWIAVPV